MTVVTIDNTDLAAVMADAGMEPVAETEPTESNPNETEGAPESSEDAGVNADPKPVREAFSTNREYQEAVWGWQRPKRESFQTQEQFENAFEEWEDKGIKSDEARRALAKKTVKLRAAEEFAAHQVREKQAAEARVSDLERKLRELQPPKEAAKEPERSDFKSDDEYIEARADWKADQKLAAREAQRLQAELDAGVERRFKSAMEAVPDFQHIIEANPLSFPEHMRAYVRESDMSAEICYHFAKDPQALAKVVALHPVRQLVELGKIEARLQPFGSSASSSKKEGDEPSNGKVAKAPPSTQDTGFSPSKARSDAPVIKPLSSSDGAQVEVDPEKMTTRQMIEDFQKTNRVNLSARKRH